MPEIHFHSAQEQLEALRTRRITSRELLEQSLDRVVRLNPAINAVVTLDEAGARQRADELDAARAQGRVLGALHGLPMTVKDTLETAGLRTTAGAVELAGHVPTRNAVVVERLLEAGAVIFGKTNTPTMAMDLQSYNPIFGTTNNPWDLRRTPGGSSGGSAAALAAGFTALEVGSDIGGSIRTPAHFCGVFGHKPSFGVVPQRGHIPRAPGSLTGPDIAVVGPLARDAGDLALALDVLAGPDEGEAVGWKLELPVPRQHQLGAFRIAAWLDDPESPVDASVAVVHQAALERLRAAGAHIDERARPQTSFAEAVDLYRRLLNAATSDGFSEQQFQQIAARADKLPATAQDAASVFLRSASQRHREWIVLNDRRERLRRVWRAFFADFDVLLCPVTQTAALLHDHSEPVPRRVIQINGVSRPYFDQLAWVGMIGSVYLPSTVAPVGRTEAGLPVGIQIVGPYLEDRTTIAFAQALQEALGGFVPPPGY